MKMAIGKRWRLKQKRKKKKALAGIENNIIKNDGNIIVKEVSGGMKKKKN
jgi:hypothetical protein